MGIEIVNSILYFYQHTMKKFEVGKTYSTRSICDYNCIFSFTVVKRTEKTITLNYRGNEYKVRIRTGSFYDPNNTDEWAYPLGQYSMSPFIEA
jgi:hypothetical protein